MNIQMVRDIAKAAGTETDLSIAVTNKLLLPMDAVLLKYSKHKFQYNDEMEYLQDLYLKLKPIPTDNLHDFIHPKFLINRYDNYNIIKTAFLMKFMAADDPANHKKLLEYFAKFDELFPGDFCMELRQCFLDSIEKFKQNS